MESPLLNNLFFQYKLHIHIDIWLTTNCLESFIYTLIVDDVDFKMNNIQFPRIVMMLTLCSHLQHRRLPWRQSLVSPVTTKLAYQPPVSPVTTRVAPRQLPMVSVCQYKSIAISLVNRVTITRLDVISWSQWRSLDHKPHRQCRANPHKDSFLMADMFAPTNKSEPKQFVCYHKVTATKRKLL